MQLTLFRSAKPVSLKRFTAQIAATQRSTVYADGDAVLKIYNPTSYLRFIKQCLVEPHKFFSERTGQKVLATIGIHCPVIRQGGFIVSRQGVSTYLIMDYLSGSTLEALCRTVPDRASNILPLIIADIHTMMANNLLHTDINLENIYIIDDQVWWLDSSIRHYRCRHKLQKSLAKAIRRLGSPSHTPFNEPQLERLLNE